MKCVFPSVITGSSLTSVGLDWVFVQFGDDVLVHTRDLEHTVVPPPVFRGDWWNLQVNAHLEGPVMVGEDLPVVHVPHEAPPLLSSRTTRLCRGRNLSRGRWLERRETSGGEKSWEALGRKKKDSLWVIITYCTLITSFLFDPIHFALVVCVNKRDKWTNWDVSERQRLKWCKDTGVDDVTSK